MTKRSSPRSVMKAILGTVAVLTLLLALVTRESMQPIPDSLQGNASGATKKVYLDRYGERLNVTYANRWNYHDRIALHEAPEFLIDAILRSEDKRFFDHGGIDWLARINAARQNLLAGKVVRGASTISEQVVRMHRPRPRTLWSRWLEGFEAMALERRFSKLEILEFYINQVPYRARRRGVIQAAGYYFDRDISTLNKKEMLALAVLVRSPEWFDPVRHSENLNRAIDDLAQRLELAEVELDRIGRQVLALQQPKTNADVSHYVRFIESQQQFFDIDDGLVSTTIDLELQLKAQAILDNQLDRLEPDNAGNGAILVVDHDTNQILSWVVGYAGRSDKAYNQIDAVLAQRQPGSTLKPFLYAQAIRDGWTATTMLDDAPLDESVGFGLHSYRNYSRSYYGMISVREALGNSLNVPAVKAVQYVGPENFLAFLNEFGIESLSAHPNVYGDGLALGNGELSLYELVRAYTALARMGDYKELSALSGQELQQRSYRVLSEDVASLIADILSDPAAREKEFGWDSVLSFPHQSAVKTGTSSDYRDAWALGFNDRYTVGVWIGNLDYSEMNEITGSTGAALILRSIFSQLNQYRDVRPLYFSANLDKKKVCVDSGLPASRDCEARDEWFVKGTQPQGPDRQTAQVRIRKPSKGLRLAMDPRIPDENEYFEFAVSEHPDISEVRWYLNDELVAATAGSKYNWKLARGEYQAYAEVKFVGETAPVRTQSVKYRVN